MKKDIGMDLGGTNLRIAPVDRSSGRICGPIRILESQRFQKNETLTSALRELIPGGPDEYNVHIGSAGEIKGLTILGSPNFAINGPITVAEDLKQMGFDVKAVNDMGAAVSHAARWGPGKGLKKVAVGTYSSGQNFAVMDLGQLIPMEFSHVVGPPQPEWLSADDLRAVIWQFCMRKNLDLSESQLILNGITDFNAKRTGLLMDGLPELSAEALKDPKRSQDAVAQAIFAIETFPDDFSLAGKVFDSLEALKDKRLFCGCSGRGHLETDLTGNGAAWMSQRFFMNRTRMMEHPIMRMALEKCNKDLGTNFTPDEALHDAIYPLVLRRVNAKMVYDAYRVDPSGEPQSLIREFQADSIADSFCRLASNCMSIELLVCMGSMTNDWKEVFEPAISRASNGSPDFVPFRYALGNISIPKIVRNEEEHIGLLGAVSFGMYVEEKGRMHQD
jgi:hypothetical protein